MQKAQFVLGPQTGLSNVTTYDHSTNSVGKVLQAAQTDQKILNHKKTSIVLGSQNIANPTTEAQTAFAKQADSNDHKAMLEGR